MWALTSTVIDAFCPDLKNELMENSPLKSGASTVILSTDAPPALALFSSHAGGAQGGEGGSGRGEGGQHHTAEPESCVAVAAALAGGDSTTPADQQAAGEGGGGGVMDAAAPSEGMSESASGGAGS